MGWSDRRPCFRWPSDQGPFTDTESISGRAAPWASGTGVVPGYAPAVGHIGTGRREHGHAQRGQRMERSSFSFSRRPSAARVRLKAPCVRRARARREFAIACLSGIPRSPDRVSRSGRRILRVCTPAARMDVFEWYTRTRSTPVRKGLVPWPEHIERWPSPMRSSAVGVRASHDPKPRMRGRARPVSGRI